MKVKRIFTLLYLVALAFILLYVTRENFDIQESLAKTLYYIGIGIFVVGVIRVFYLLSRNK